MDRDNVVLSYGQRTASELPLVEQRRRSRQVTKKIAGKASKAFKTTLERELKKLEKA